MFPLFPALDLDLPVPALSQACADSAPAKKSRRRELGSFRRCENSRGNRLRLFLKRWRPTVTAASNVPSAVKYTLEHEHVLLGCHKPSTQRSLVHSANSHTRHFSSVTLAGASRSGCPSRWSALLGHRFRVGAVSESRCRNSSSSENTPASMVTGLFSTTN